MPPKAIYRFNVILIKFPVVFFPENNNAKICVEPQNTSNSESKLDKEKRWSHHIS